MTTRGHVYTPDSAKEWKERIGAHFIIHRKPIITEPVFLELVFYFSRPKRLLHCRVYPHTAKPDEDNLQKAVMDAMTDAGVWKDDALVFGNLTQKWYSEGPSGVWIIVKVWRQES
jgi:Holliday junction resolvase RusA-like endonuclease